MTNREIVRKMVDAIDYSSNKVKVLEVDAYLFCNNISIKLQILADFDRYSLFDLESMEYLDVEIGIDNITQRQLFDVVNYIINTEFKYLIKNYTCSFHMTAVYNSLIDLGIISGETVS